MEKRKYSPRKKYILIQSKLNLDIGFFAALGEAQFPDKIPYKPRDRRKKKIIEPPERITHIIRPKAEYSNHTPYGIADQLHRMEAFV